MLAEPAVSVTPGQEAYERDRIGRPDYHTGEARPQWSELGDAARAAWDRNVSEATLASEVAKDRSGKHGGEVA